MIGKDVARCRSECVTLSAGEKQFEYDNIVVKPVMVTLERTRNRLMVVDRAISSDPRAPAEIDQLSARVTAFVVTRALKRSLPRNVTVALYLSYPGNVQLEIESTPSKTAQLIADFRQRDRRRYGTGLTQSTISKIPGQVFAYAVCATQRFL